MKYEKMWVKELQKVNTDKGAGDEITYKAILERHGEQNSPRITIRSDEPIDLIQGEKEVVVEFKCGQQRLK